MRVRVLRELPQGQQPGTVIDVSDEYGRVLILVGAVEPESPSPESPPSPSPSAAPRSRRYRRRDLVPES